MPDFKSLSSDKFRTFDSSYKSVVVDVNDPQQRGRFRVKCYEIYGKHTSPWVEYSSTFSGSSDYGMFFVPDPGSNVYIKCRNGNANTPVYDGGMSPKTAPPKLARGQQDGSREEKGTIKEDVFLSSKSFEEPSDQYGTIYPFNKTIKTKAGHLFELDDSPNSERVRLRHKAGTEIEFYPDGSALIVIKNEEFKKTYGQSNNVYEKDFASRHKGSVGITIDVDGSIKILGELSIMVDGNTRIYCKKDINMHSEGNLNLSASKNISMNSKGEIIKNASRIVNAEG